MTDLPEDLTRPSLGDVPDELFRQHLHELADWIADYRENIDERPISPTAEPGAILRVLPQTAPESGEPLQKILQDVYELVVPGIVHWGHPQFMGYFGCTTTAPGILGEMIAAALNVRLERMNAPFPRTVVLRALEVSQCAYLIYRRSGRVNSDCASVRTRKAVTSVSLRQASD